MPCGNDGLYFYVVQPSDTLSRIVARHFDVRTARESSQKMAEVAGLSYLKDPERLRTGQLLVLGDDRQQLPISRMAERVVDQADLLRMEQSIQTLSPAEKSVLRSHWDIIQNLDEVGRSVSGFSSEVVTVAEERNIGRGNDVVGGAIEGTTRIAEHVFRNPNQAARGAAMGEIFQYVAKAGNAARSVRSRAVGAIRRGPISRPSAFTIRISPTIVSSRALVAQMDLMQKIVRGTKWVTRGSMFVTVALSACKVAAAKPGERARTAAGEAGSLVVGGATAAVAAYGVCNLILGLPTAGTSMLWCGLLVGGVAGAAGVSLGGKLGEKAYDGAAALLDSNPGNDYFLEAAYW